MAIDICVTHNHCKLTYATPVPSEPNDVQIEAQNRTIYSINVAYDLDHSYKIDFNQSRQMGKNVDGKMNNNN